MNNIEISTEMSEEKAMEMANIFYSKGIVIFNFQKQNQLAWSWVWSSAFLSSRVCNLSLLSKLHVLQFHIYCFHRILKLGVMSFNSLNNAESAKAFHKLSNIFLKTSSEATYISRGSFPPLVDCYDILPESTSPQVQPIGSGHTFQRQQRVHLFPTLYGFFISGTCPLFPKVSSLFWRSKNG